jgi:hypothetical protein
MSLHDDQPPRRLKSREEILAEAKLLPPRSEMVIEDLTDEEFDACQQRSKTDPFVTVEN